MVLGRECDDETVLDVEDAEDAVGMWWLGCWPEVYALWEETVTAVIMAVAHL